MGGKSPDPPPLPPPPPPPPNPVVDETVRAARHGPNLRGRLVSSRDRDIHTSPAGLPSIFDNNRRTLLGS